MSVEPRQAASLILLRDAAGGAEVLLVQRNPEQRFMGGAWVFPGGAVHDGQDADNAATAVRELEEEAGIAMPADAELVPFSRWITPEGELVSIRFDTWLFAARAPDCAVAMPDVLAAQTVLDRTPNIDAGLTGAPGVLHFNFVHRFSSSDAPERIREEGIRPPAIIVIGPVAAFGG